MLTDKQIIAFIPILQRYGRKLLHTFDVDDFVQGALEHILTKRALYTEEDKGTKWMAVVAHNWYISQVRKKKREDAAMTEFIREVRDTVPSDAEDRILLQETVDRLNRIPNGLALLAYYLEPGGGMTQKDKRTRFQVRKELNRA